MDKPAVALATASVSSAAGTLVLEYSPGVVTVLPNCRRAHGCTELPLPRSGERIITHGRGKPGASTVESGALSSPKSWRGYDLQQSVQKYQRGRPFWSNELAIHGVDGGHRLASSSPSSHSRCRGAGDCDARIDAARETAALRTGEHFRDSPCK